MITWPIFASRLAGLVSWLGVDLYRLALLTQSWVYVGVLSFLFLFLRHALSSQSLWDCFFSSFTINGSGDRSRPISAGSAAV